MYNNLTPRLCKDESQKLYLDFYLDNKQFITNKNGEIDILLENEDRSLSKNIIGWKADKAQENPDCITLSGMLDLKEFTTYLYITVIYKKVNALCWEKQIQLKQTNIPTLYFSIKTPLTSPDVSHLWSFDNACHKGGLSHGTYPAAGFVNKYDVSGGILSDAGHRNYFTRNIRRRPTPGKLGFTAIRRLCDGKMLSLNGDTAYLQLGLLSDYTHGDKLQAKVPNSAQWLCEGDCKANEQGFSGEGKCGGYLPFDIADGYYTLKFDYKSAAPVSVKVLRSTPDSEICAFHYQDFPANGGEWSSFDDTFFIADTQGMSTLIKIYEQEKGSGELLIKNLTLTKHEGEDYAYHPLTMGKAEARRLFVFAQQGSDIRSLRLASQLKLAEGLGFEGSEPEKILYADMQMLTWITSENDFSAHNVPNINYAPDMYNRDSFWSVAGIDDKDLSESIFKRWGLTQTEEGGIGTIVTPCMGSVEVKDNEATCEWLWWAHINRVKYKIEPDWDKILRAWKFCVKSFDPKGTGICEAHFVLGQNDVTTFPDNKKNSDICLNQGVWAITLKVAKALGLPVPDSQIEASVNAYRAFYSPERGHMINDRLHPTAISTGDLMPEFVSLWLFNEPMLDDDMVCSTLEHIPHRGEFAFFMGDTETEYLNEENKPCDKHFSWPNGIYYNGGSWLREEAMAYATAARHGWAKAKERFEARLLGEINANPNEPFSHEYIPTDLTYPGCWSPSTRVFCWNVFALKAKDVGGF